MDTRPPSTLSERARFYALTLTRWPSVTGTTDEAAFAQRLFALIREIPYFAAHPEDLIVAPIPGDPLGRANVIAHVRGSGDSAVLLSGHFDTVPTDDYGPLQPLAGEPEALRDALVERLATTGEDPSALEDLVGGAFLPGRGLLDMKAGVAAGLAVLEAFAADSGRRGNLVLVATPDEEESSAGMRAAADLLPGWLSGRRLVPRLDINLDAICDEGDGTTGQVVAFGCIGKLLLSAFVVGQESHAAYPFAGVNAAHLAAELVAEIECAPELAEVENGDLAAPPTVLGARDLKAQYNVTLPGTAFVFWNVLVHRRRAGEVLAVAADLARRALRRADLGLAEKAARLGVAVTRSAGWSDIPILTFAELRAHAEAHDPSFEARFADRAQALARDASLDLPTRARALFEETFRASGLKGPAVILGFGSMPYPAIVWPEGAGELRRLVDAAREETARATRTPIGATSFFPAIADMSFIGPVDEADLAETARQTPLWGSSIRWDLSRGATPALPIVNIGPWGRDYHHWLERLHAPYAFDVLPALVQAVARNVLGA